MFILLNSAHPFIFCKTFRISTHLHHSSSSSSPAPAQPTISPPGTKLQLNVCSGPKCKQASFAALEAAILSNPKLSLGQIDLQTCGCFDACGKGPNVAVALPNGAGVSLSGMTEPERLRRCFMGIKDSGVTRLLTEVTAWIEEEPTRLQIAKEAMVAAADVTLTNDECENRDVCLIIKKVTSRDVSDKGYTREKLLALLSRTALGKVEAQKLLQ